MRRSRLDWFLAALSGLALALPYHRAELWPLAFVSLIPLFYAFAESDSSRSAKLGFVAGYVHFAVLGYWLTNVNVFGYVILAGYLAIYPALFGAFAHGFLTSSRLRGALAAAAVWTAGEYLRSWMISGFPWALAGYTQWKNLAYIQIAEIIGPYGVSFLVIWTNIMLYRLLQSFRGARSAALEAPSPLRPVLWLAAVTVVVYGFGFWTLARWDRFYGNDLPKATLRISVIQGNIPQEEKWDVRIKTIIFEKYKRLTSMAAMEKPDLIIWPETSFPGYMQDEPMMAAHVRQLARQSGSRLLIGAPTMTEPEEELHFYNSAILFGEDGEEKFKTHKTHLVPFGEYIPFEPLIGFIRHFVDIGHFSPGQERVLMSMVTQNRPSAKIAAKFGVLICYEDIFPDEVREMCARGADFLVNITNDAWFGKTSAPYQHAQASVFRAIENRVPIIRATNTGLSCFITAEGRVIASVSKDGEEIMVSGHKTQDMILKKGRPFYTRVGDVFLWVVLLILFFTFRDRHRSRGYSRL